MLFMLPCRRRWTKSWYANCGSFATPSPTDDGSGAPGLPPAVFAALAAPRRVGVDWPVAYTGAAADT